MTTPDLRPAARAYLERWQSYLASHPDADQTAVSQAMRRGDPPPDDTPAYSPAAPDMDIFQLSPLGHAYTTLLAEGWSKNQALYMAWKAHPKEVRKAAGLPEKQIDLFTQVLRYKSDTAVRMWRQKYDGRDADHPDIEARIGSLVKDSPLSFYRPRVIEALAMMASLPSPQTFSDRRLFLEMVGDYIPNSKTDITTGGEKLKILFAWGDHDDGDD